MIKSPCYTQFPNEILDEWMPKLSPSEFKIISKIIRQTFGWKKESDNISLSQIIKSTGISRQGVINGIKKLEEYNLIIVTRTKNKTSNFQLNIDDSQLNRPEIVNSVDQGSTLSLHEKYQVVNSVDQGSQLSRPQVVNSVDPQKKDKETTTKENIIYILNNKWNSLPKVVKRRTDTVINHINKKQLLEIEELGIDNVLKSFENYNIILSNPDKYWYTYSSYNIWNFISKALDKFIPSSNPLETFKIKEKKSYEPRDEMIDKYGVKIK